MSSSLSLIATINGDPLSAISDCVNVANVFKETVPINCKTFTLYVRPDSNILDIKSIYDLNIELQKLKV